MVAGGRQMEHDHGLEAAYGACQSLVRRADKDRFLSALFVGEEDRQHFFALAAFNVEIARVRETVSEPMPGEVRFQWWRDALMGTARGDVASHPVACALLGTIQERRLPVKAFLDLIDARSFDLYDDPMPNINALEGYCGETASALFQLGALCLAGGHNPDTAGAAGHAGVAYGLVGLMRALPIHVRRGQCYLPLDMLRQHGVSREEVVSGVVSKGLIEVLKGLRQQALFHFGEAQAILRGIHKSLHPAFLPLALIPAYLQALQAGAQAPFTRLAEVAQWRRQLILWRAARK